MYTRRDAKDGVSRLRHVAASSAPLTLEEEQSLARAARHGDAVAFDRLVRSHLRLVLAIASEYRRFGAALSDLISEGALGLVIATRRFDPDRGARLAVYASFWIRAMLRRFTLATRRIVGAPSTRRGRQLIANLARTERELSQMLGAKPDREALATRLTVSADEIAEVELALRDRDACLRTGDTDPRDGVEVASDDPSPELLASEAEQRSQMEATLKSALSRLVPRQREIVVARRFRTEPPTLEHLGRGYGISSERVRQLEAAGYQKLREAVLESVS